MRVTVVIATYNRRDQLRRAIDSVLNQTKQPHEVIVVDDGSCDGTHQMLQADYADKVKVYHQPNKGVSAARNRGIEEADGEWTAFLDSDDWWLPGKLAEQINFHRKFPGFLISQTDEIWIRDNVRVNPKKYHSKKAGWIFDICLERCMITPSAVMVNKQIFEDVGMFDEQLPACEDYDLWLRITRKYQVGLVDKKLVVKTGGHHDQLSCKYWGMDRFRIQALEKLLDYPLEAEKERSVLDTLIKKSLILAQGSQKRNRPDGAYLYNSKAKKYLAMLECQNESCQKNY